MSSKYYLHSAIPYVNAAPHIGHAQEFVISDSLRRFHSLRGQDVLYLCGADENGLKIVQAAERAGQTPQQFADAQQRKFLETASQLHVEFDVWQRGTDKEHHFRSSQILWDRCVKSGDIYRKTYAGLYCVGCESFYTADELDANMECPEHPGKPLETVTEENYFFALSKYQQFLERIISTDQLEIVPHVRKNEALAFIRKGLSDFSVSRSRHRAKNWGVPVPDDPSQFMYVWFDALNIYQSGIGFGWDDQRYRTWWPPELMIIGKGILRFHAVYWMAILKSAGLDLPKRLFVHGYLTVNGKKMSKTIGNVVDPNDLVGRFGTDAVRYYLLREIPSIADGDYSERRFLELYHADLSHGLGNLASRVATLAATSDFSFDPFPDMGFDPAVVSAIDQLRLDTALEQVWKLIRDANLAVDTSSPWKLEGQQLKRTLSDVVNRVRVIGYNLQPFLPESATKIMDAFRGPKIFPLSPLFPRLRTTAGT